jgi:hypothetical protein
VDLRYQGTPLSPIFEPLQLALATGPSQSPEIEPSSQLIFLQTFVPLPQLEVELELAKISNSPREPPRDSPKSPNRPGNQIR